MIHDKENSELIEHENGNKTNIVYFISNKSEIVISQGAKAVNL